MSSQIRRGAQSKQELVASKRPKDEGSSACSLNRVICYVVTDTKALKNKWRSYLRWSTQASASCWLSSVCKVHSSYFIWFIGQFKEQGRSYFFHLWVSRSTHEWNLTFYIWQQANVTHTGQLLSFVGHRDSKWKWKWQKTHQIPLTAFHSCSVTKTSKEWSNGEINVSFNCVRSREKDYCHSLGMQFNEVSTVSKIQALNCCFDLFTENNSLALMHLSSYLCLKAICITSRPTNKIMLRWTPEPFLNRLISFYRT